MSEAPSHWEMAEVELKDIPFYDADIESAGEPEAVKRLKAAIADADGVIMVTPEYNNGMPAILKNAIDWASSHQTHLLYQIKRLLLPEPRHKVLGRSKHKRSYVKCLVQSRLAPCQDQKF